MHKTYTPLKLLLPTAGIFYIIFILRTAFRIKGVLYFTLIDDAMVSMRYAHHIAQGFGPLWNIGEQPVEGFTNPGWMFLMALLHLFSLPSSKISLLVMVISGLILLANTLIVFRLCEVFQTGSKYAPLLAAIVTAFYFPLVFWSLRGMEVGLLTLLINTSVLIAMQFTSGAGRRALITLGLVFFLAVLVRMDSILQILIICFFLIWKVKFKIQRLTLPLLILAATVITILWLQHAYFGDFLPNTYYQKVVGAPLGERIKYGLLAFYQYATRDILMLVFVSLAGVILYKNLHKPETLLLAGLFVVQCIYSIWVGGDYAEVEVDSANRFITQGMPALIILFSLVTDRIISDLLSTRRPKIISTPQTQSIISLSIALATILIISGKPWTDWTIDNSPLLKADIRRVKVGLAIAEYTSPQVTIAIHAAGQIPYYSDRRSIDLLGLNDPVIARGPVTGPFYPGHDKWNYDYSIMHLKPDLVADNWIRLGDFMKDKNEYQELDNGMYIRKDSTLIDVSGLLK